MTNRRRQSIVAIACGIAAVLAVFVYTASIESEASVARAAALSRYGGEQASVLVATADIPVGQSVDASNTQVQEWLVDLLPEGEVATSLDEVEGKLAQVDIKANEPVLAERVGTGVSRISVPKGLAAVTVSSDDVLAVGGAIKAGSFVDVYVETAKGNVELLGQKILVLETSQQSSSAKEQVTWVTLAVTPQSVSELISASTKGTIHFALPSGTQDRG